MKKLIAIIALTLFASTSFAAETFVPVTKDNEVVSINDVQVKKVITTEVVEEKAYTLPQIDADIAKIQARITHLQGDIAVLQELKAKIETEVKKVILKKAEEPKPIEEVK
jgi:TolA-binding protein